MNKFEVHWIISHMDPGLDILNTFFDIPSVTVHAFLLVPLHIDIDGATSTPNGSHSIDQ